MPSCCGPLLKPGQFQVGLCLLLTLSLCIAAMGFSASSEVLVDAHCSAPIEVIWLSAEASEKANHDRPSTCGFVNGRFVHRSQRSLPISMTLGWRPHSRKPSCSYISMAP